MEFDKPLAVKLRKRFEALKNARLTWESDWKVLAEHFLPHRMILLNEGDKTNESNLNTTLVDDMSVRAMRVLGAGLQGGLTSPARPWFRLRVQSQELSELKEVSLWLTEVQRRMLGLFASSNFYSAIHTLYQELGTFGTNAMTVLEDPISAIRFHTLTAGEYYLAADYANRVKTLFRIYEATAEQIVEQFREENISISVKDSAKDSSRKDTYFQVVHAIMPNPELVPGRLGYKGKPFLSVYWEYKSSEIDYPYLSISGFEEQPFVAPRWNVKGNDVYGSSPGMEALADSKQLQSMTKTLLSAEHKKVNPPMNAPPTLRHASLVPGAVNFVDSSGQKFEPAMTVSSDARGTMLIIETKKADIEKGLYNDLFQMLAIADTNMTATEVRERVEEKLILLGPVLERLQSELLDPIIDRVFAIMLRRNELPPPPEVLQNQDLKVEYISLLAQAQKLVGTESIERFMLFTQRGAQTYQEMLDVFDADEAAEEYGELIGISPAIIRDRVGRKKRREGRAAQQAALQQAELMSQGIEDFKNLSQTQVEGDNALTAVTEGMENV